ncbi:MAG TPA: hypothetical protein VFL92_13090 [Sphingomonas sp.]|nr:hypothetical protein [Sphingomonas sp.]
MAQFGRALAQVPAQRERQSLDLLRCHGRLRGGEATVEIRDLLGQLIAAELQGHHPIPQGCVVRIHQSFLDQFQQAGEPGFGFLVRRTKLPELVAVPVLAFDSGAQIVRHVLS